MSPGEIIVVGCKSCGSYGQIFFYDAKNLNLTYTLDGDRDHEDVGERILYMPETGYSEQYWYTSKDGGTITLNSIVFFK